MSNFLGYINVELHEFFILLVLISFQLETATDGKAKAVFSEIIVSELKSAVMLFSAIVSKELTVREESNVAEFSSL